MSKKRVKEKIDQKSSAQAPVITATILPRRSLQQVIPILKFLHENYAGKAASVEQIAQGLGIKAGSANTNYLFSAAQAYNLLNRESGQYSISEVGRKIIAPTFDGEDREGKVKAVLTPTMLSKFYNDFNNHPIPNSEFFPNVLESKYGVPRERTSEAIGIVIQNAEFAGILENKGPNQSPIIRISTSSAIKNAVGLESEINVDPTVASSLDGAEWEKVCFFITPIGDEGTEVRKHADMLLKHLLEPTFSELGLRVVRSDAIDRSGLITQQIFEHVARAGMCVADLSYGNANAFYELGIRHMCQLPTIQIIRKGDKIPFDVSQGRTIVIDTSDVYTVMDRVQSAKRELSEHAKHFLSPDRKSAGDDNPVSVYLPGVKVTLPK